MTAEELKKELSKYNSTVALLYFQETQDVTILRRFYEDTLNVPANQVPRDAKTLLRGIYGAEVGDQLYNSTVMPNRFNVAANNFASDDGAALKAVCKELGVSNCNFSGETGTQTISSMLNEIYKGQTGVNIPELASNYSKAILAQSKETAVKANVDATDDRVKYGMAYDPFVVAEYEAATGQTVDTSALSNPLKQKEEVLAIAVKATNIFSSYQNLNYILQNSSSFGDYDIGLAYGEALMDDKVTGGNFDVQKMGLSAAEKFSLGFNKLAYQYADVTKTAKNVATNYATSVSQNYSGPVNTNISDIALKGADSLGIFDTKNDDGTITEYNYQAAQNGYYFSQGLNNVGATLADWAVTAGTYLALSNHTSLGYYGTSVNQNTLSYKEIADQATKAGDEVKANIQKDFYTKQAENYIDQDQLQYVNNPDVKQSIINKQVQDFVTFQTDEEVNRSRKELNWEMVEKVVAPTVAIITLPVAIASGAGLGIVAGMATSAFSLYQGAGMKGQALDAQTTAIGRYGYEDGINIAAQDLANNPVVDEKTGETVTYKYDEALKIVEEQNEMLNKQANMMLASSAVSALTSGAGIIQGLVKVSGGVSILTGQVVNGASQFALNTASAMSTAGRLGGIGLSVANVVNSSQTLFDENASAEEKWMSGLSTFVAASGAIGNSFGFIKNPTTTTKAIQTWGDVILDVASVPSGVAIDMQQVSKACYDDDYPGDEDACRNAWVGLALSLTQDLVQVGNSTTEFSNYRAKANYRATDSIQRIDLVDTEISKILSNPNRSVGDNLKLGELQLYRESLVASALAINSNLKIPEIPVTTVLKTSIPQVRTEDLMQTAAQNRSNLLSRAADLEQSNPNLAVQLRQQADDVFNRQLEVSSLGDQIRSIDEAINQDFDKISVERIEELRKTRDSLVAELDNKVNDPAYQAHNLSVENKQLAISLKENEVFKAYDEFRSLEQEQIRIQDQNIPPPATNLTKQTGLATIFPKIAEQNKALDLIAAQNKVAEIEKLNLEKSNLEKTAELGDSSTKIEEINKQIADANAELNKIAESTEEQGFWQRLKNILPGSKTEKNYNEAILALKDINKYNQDNIRLEELSDKHLKGDLSVEERQEFNRLLDDLEGADQRYTQSQEKINQALTKVTDGLQNNQGSSGVVAFINRATEGIKNIFSPSGSKKQFNLQTELKISKNDLDLLSQRDKLAGDLNKYQEGLTQAEKAIGQVPEEQKLILQQDIEAYKQKIEITQNELVKIDDQIDVNTIKSKYFQTIVAGEEQKILEEAFNKRDPVAFSKEVENIKNTALDKLKLSVSEKILVEELITSKEIINSAKSDPKFRTIEEINQARAKYAENLTELSKSILGENPDLEAYQRLGEVQNIIKKNDLLGTIKEDSNIGEILASQEIRLNTDNPLVATKMANIVREMELRTGATEGVPFFNSRTNQIDTMLKILSGDRIAVELTTAGGKTFVGAAVLKIQREIIGYETGIYIAKPGQEADIQKSMAIAYGIEPNKIPILDNSKLSDGNYLKSLKEAAFIIADPAQIQFIRNTALNVKDPNFKTAVEVYSKLSKNASIYVDELQITLDPSRQAINSVGPSTQDIPQSYKDAANLIGNALDQTVLKDGGWGLGDNSFLVLRTKDGAEIAKFSKSAQAEIFNKLAKETGITAQKYGIVADNAVEIERALNQGEDVLAVKLTELGVADVTTAKVNQVLDQVDMLNSFAQGLKMQRGTDYIRGVDGVLSKNGGPNRNVTIPAAGGVSNEGQSYKANLQVAMEYIGARAYGDDVNFSGLKSSPNEAFRSNISSYFASLKNSSVGAVTGAMADGAGVVEVSLGLTTYRSTEAVDKIVGIEGVASGGRVVAERSYAIGRGQDVDAVVALKNSNKLDMSDGRASNGNLKIVMGTDGAEDPIKFAISLAETDAFKDSEFAVQNANGTYSKIKIQDGQVSSTTPITTKQIQDLYDSEAKNLITIIGRGGATGDSIKTAGNIPGITITSSKTPVGLVAQAGARIDRGDEIADQYALIISPGASRADIDKPMTSADFAQFKNEIVNNQKIVEQAKNTQALDHGVTTASNRVLESLIFESRDVKVKEWASNLLLKFSTEQGARDLDLDGGSQTSLAARQKKVESEVAKWKEVLADSANASILKQISSNNPELYKTILSNAGTKSKLAYASTGAQATTTKEAVITADNLEDFVRRHNLFVTADSESKVVASSSKSTETEQIATKNQQNNNEVTRAAAELNAAKNTIKDLTNVVANPIKMAIELGNGNVVKEILKTPSRIANYVKNLDAIQENAINNYRAQRESLANLITSLEAEPDVNLQADLQQQIDNLEKEIAAVPFLTKASNFVNERTIGENKGRFASVLNFFTNLFGGEEIAPEVVAQKDKVTNDLKITDEKTLADLAALKTAEDVANFVAAKQTAYQNLKDQFTALNTVKPAINNEEDYKAQEEKFNQTVAEIKDLQDRSGLAFITIADDGSISRVNEDQFANLSTFRAKAEAQAGKLAKEAEQKAQEEKLLAKQQAEKERQTQEKTEKPAEEEINQKNENNVEKEQPLTPAKMEVVTSIGRKSDNSLQIIPSITAVSRYHAQIIRDENNNLYIRDLNSTYGTHVNGVRIGAESNVALNENDTIFLGSSDTYMGVRLSVLRDGNGVLQIGFPESDRYAYVATSPFLVGNAENSSQINEAVNGQNKNINAVLKTFKNTIQQAYQNIVTKLSNLLGPPKIDSAQLAYTIGRHKNNSLQVPGELGYVSRHHAQVIQDENNNLYIRDLNSTNGTYVNGQRITAYKLRPLNVGDIIFLGKMYELGATFKVISNDFGQWELEPDSGSVVIDEELEEELKEGQKIDDELKKYQELADGLSVFGEYYSTTQIQKDYENLLTNYKNIITNILELQKESGVNFIDSNNGLYRVNPDWKGRSYREFFEYAVEKVALNLIKQSGHDNFDDFKINLDFFQLWLTFRNYGLEGITQKIDKEIAKQESIYIVQDLIEQVNNFVAKFPIINDSLQGNIITSQIVADLNQASYFIELLKNANLTQNSSYSQIVDLAIQFNNLLKTESNSEAIDKEISALYFTKLIPIAKNAGLALNSTDEIDQFRQILAERPNFEQEIRQIVDMKKNSQVNEISALASVTSATEAIQESVPVELFEGSDGYKTISKSTIENKDSAMDFYQAVKKDVFDLLLSEQGVSFNEKNIEQYLEQITKLSSWTEYIKNHFKTTLDEDNNRQEVIDLVQQALIDDLQWIRKEKFDEILFSSLFIDKPFFDGLLLTGDNNVANAYDTFGQSTRSGDVGAWDSWLNAYNFNLSEFNTNNLVNLHKTIFAWYDNPDTNPSKKNDRAGILRDNTDIRDQQPLYAKDYQTGSPLVLTQSQIDNLNNLRSLRPGVDEPIMQFVFSDKNDGPNENGLYVGYIEFCKTENVQAELEALMNWYKEQTSKEHDPYLLAAELQQRFIAIHPFRDGNGRTSRWLMNWSLKNDGLGSSIIYDTDKDMFSSINDWAAEIKKGEMRFSSLKNQITTMISKGIPSEMIIPQIEVEGTESWDYHQWTQFSTFVKSNPKLAINKLVAGNKLDRDEFYSALRDAVISFNLYKITSTKSDFGGLVDPYYAMSYSNTNPNVQEFLRKNYANDATVRRGAYNKIDISNRFTNPRDVLSFFYGGQDDLITTNGVHKKITVKLFNEINGKELDEQRSIIRKYLSGEVGSDTVGGTTSDFNNKFPDLIVDHSSINESIDEIIQVLIDNKGLKVPGYFAKHAAEIYNYTMLDVFNNQSSSVSKMIIQGHISATSLWSVSPFTSYSKNDSTPEQFSVNQLSSEVNAAFVFTSSLPTVGALYDQDYQGVYAFQKAGVGLGYNHEGEVLFAGGQNLSLLEKIDMWVLDPSNMNQYKASSVQRFGSDGNNLRLMTYNKDGLALSSEIYRFDETGKPVLINTFNSDELKNSLDIKFYTSEIDSLLKQFRGIDTFGAKFSPFTGQSLSIPTYINENGIDEVDIDKFNDLKNKLQLEIKYQRDLSKGTISINLKDNPSFEEAERRFKEALEAAGLTYEPIERSSSSVFFNSPCSDCNQVRLDTETRVQIRGWSVKVSQLLLSFFNMELRDRWRVVT